MLFPLRTPLRIACLGTALFCAGLPLLVVPCWAEDKNGVSPSAISRPSGPGSLEGLGDSFQPTLNTGTAKYSVAISLPGGPGGLSPSLALTYDSGLGQGVAGIGWTIEPGSIYRQIERGLPRYIDEPTADYQGDRLVGLEGEALVPLAKQTDPPSADHYFLGQTEGGFVRYRSVADHGRLVDHWEAHAKNGTKLEFGLTSAARVSDEATENKIFRWCLERQTDTNGNVAEYNYLPPDPADRQVYLHEIRYGPGSPPWEAFYSAVLEYEDRPDPWTDYRSGFRVRSAKRLRQIDVMYRDTLVRRYLLNYDPQAYVSLLSAVRQLGADGVTELPTTRFGYATMPLRTGSLSASKFIIPSEGEPDPLMDASNNIEFVDLNSDGLPDFLITGVGHRAYLNRGTRGQGGAVRWEAPTCCTPECGPANTGCFVAGSAGDYQLSSAAVHLADMSGDGLADLVVTASHDVSYFENSGALGWGSRKLMAVGGRAPPAPFGNTVRSVTTTDLNFDKRIDVLQSANGAYFVWLNIADGQYKDALRTPGAHICLDATDPQCIDRQTIDLGALGVQLADMNGDRLADVVKVQGNGIYSCPGMGYGYFDRCVWIGLPDGYLDNGHISRAKLSDMNGDGLADLLVERYSQSDLRLWLNLGDDRLAPSCTVTDLPATPNSVTRWADINGNGTVDLVYAGPRLSGSRLNAVDLGLLLAGSEHLNSLTRIENGYGRVTHIFHRSTTEFLLDARDTGSPWTTALPFPSQVVERTETTVGLDLDGYSGIHPFARIAVPVGNDVYITDYVYRDGYYDPIEKQFRGFAFVKQIQRGDEHFGGDHAPTLVTRMRFHTGAPDGIDNNGDGLVDEYDEWNGREEEPLKGVELWQETASLPDDPARDGTLATDATVFERSENTWEVRDIATAAGGALVDQLGEGYRPADPYSRTVRQAVPTRARRTIIERLPNSAERKILETRSDVDALGDPLFEWNLGDTANPDDDSYTAYEYAHNESAWLMGLPARTVVRAGGPGGSWVSESRNYYDGPPFQGLPLAQVGARGLPRRTEALISGGAVPPITERSYLRGDPRDPDGKVDTVRQKFDEYGNVIVALDANARLNGNGQPDGNGHERRMEFDSVLHRFPVRETIVLGNGQEDLEVTATYDYRFGTPLSITNFNGNVSRFTYDTFGRLEKEILPGDDPQAPTRRYAFTLGNPVSSITTTAHTKEGDSPDVVTTKYFDGAGRRLGTFEHGGPVMSGVTLFNPRGTAFKLLQPYFGQPLDDAGRWIAHTADSPFTTTRYDAAGRPIETITPPDKNGALAHLTKVYQPLKVVEYDGEDNNPAGPHFNTPKTLISDGLGRLVEVHEIETLSKADSGTFITKYRYTLPDLLAEIEDANQNVKYMRYDGLGRRIFMNDCNRGHVTDWFDAVGNETATVDAKGQRIEYTYDGANRLLAEDYLDDDSPLSHHRSPDVHYHYDTPSDDYYMFHNVRGQLSWVEDLTGAEFRSFDSRGNPETTVKRIEQIDGSFEDYATTVYADSLGRVYQVIYPDGGVVRQEYDPRGLLSRIPHFLESMQYQASGQKASCTFGNGVVTTYDYDPRQRLARLHTASSTWPLQDLSYAYDQADNIVGITDTRSLPEGDPRTQTASYLMDNLYRLQRADGIGWSQQFDYDRLGNMTEKLSSDPAHPDEHIGAMRSGGIAGTFRRVGRNPGDPPGPHALTSADNGACPRVFDHDDNGNMTVNEGDHYLWDFKDRLGEVIKDDRDIGYVYDFTDRRVIKRVDGVQTTYISNISELRGAQLIQYIFAGGTRIAMAKGSLRTADTLTQRLWLASGWNLFSFQVEPGSLDPSVILAQIDGRYTAVYGDSDETYARFIPKEPYNTLTQLVPNRGYWIHMVQPAEVLITGSQHRSPVVLRARQCTLTGLPGLPPTVPRELFASHSAFRALWLYATNHNSWTFTSRPSWMSASGRAAIPSGTACWICSTNDDIVAPAQGAMGCVVFFHVDHQGTTNIATTDDGLTDAGAAYYPFGTVRHDYQRGDGYSNLYGFGGTELDEATGLLCFPAREYSPRYGRFCSVDPTFVDAPVSPDSAEGIREFRRILANHNLYSFAHNSPVSKTDREGKDTQAVVDWNNRVIRIQTNIAIWGEAANGTAARGIESAIEHAWNGSTYTFNVRGVGPIEMHVEFDVRVQVVDGATDGVRASEIAFARYGNADLVQLQIGATRDAAAGAGRPLASRKTGRLSILAQAQQDGTGWRSAAHEYGHLIGLADRYDDSPSGGSVPHLGWEGNIMAQSEGTVDQRNINELMRRVVREQPPGEPPSRGRFGCSCSAPGL